MNELKENRKNGSRSASSVEICEETRFEIDSLDCWECGKINCKITPYINAWLEFLDN